MVDVVCGSRSDGRGAELAEYASDPDNARP